MIHLNSLHPHTTMWSLVQYSQHTQQTVFPQEQVNSCSVSVAQVTYAQNKSRPTICCWRPLWDDAPQATQLIYPSTTTVTSKLTQPTHSGASSAPSVTPYTYIIAVEGVEHSWYVTAYDSNRDASVVQRHPAAAGLLGTVTAEQVIACRTQHAHLNGNKETFI